MMDQFYEALRKWTEQNMTAEKVIFVPGGRQGIQLLRSAAVRGIRCFNLRTETITGYIKSKALPFLQQHASELIDRQGMALLLRPLMEEYPDAFATMGKVEQATATRVADMLYELILCKASTAQLKKIGHGVLSELMSDLTHVLESENKLLFPPCSRERDSVLFAAPSTLSITPLEREWLEIITGGRLLLLPVDTYIGRDVKQCLSVADHPIDFNWPEKTHCICAQDEGTEISAALRAAVEQRIPAEQIMLLCPNEETGVRVLDEAERLGINATSSYGRPLRSTRTLIAIRAFVEWFKNDYEIEQLAAAMLSGSISASDENGEIVIYGIEMLTLLRKLKSDDLSFITGWGKDRIALLESIAAQLTNEKRKKKAVFLASLLADWVQTFETPLPAEKMYQKLRFLLQHSCVQTGEQEAVFQLMRAIAGSCSGVLSAADLLSLTIAEAEKTTYNNSSDQPGKIYITGWREALFCDRPYIYIIGMTRENLDQPGREFPLLHDDEKRSLSSDLHTKEDRAKENRDALMMLMLNKPLADYRLSYACQDQPGGSPHLAGRFFDEAGRCFGITKAEILNRVLMTEMDVKLKAGFADDNEYSTVAIDADLWSQLTEGLIFSPSSIERLCECPRRFVYEQVLKLHAEEPEATPRDKDRWLSSADRGNLVHRVLEEVFRDDLQNEKQITDCFDRICDEYRKMIPVPPEAHPQKEINVMWQMVNAVLRKRKTNNSKTLAVEYSFGKTDAPMQMTFGSHSIAIRGKIDRVDQNEYGREIIDYKTGNAGHFCEHLSDKLQWYLYARAWEAEHPDQQIRFGKYYLLNHNDNMTTGDVDEVTIIADETNRTLAEEKITYALGHLFSPARCLTSAIDLQITTDETPDCCRYCPFVTICQTEDTAHEHD